MITAFRWLLCCTCLITIFFVSSAFGQSDVITTDAEFKLDRSLLGQSDMQEVIRDINPYAIIEVGSEFIKKLDLTQPNPNLAKSAHSYISVRGASFIHHENFSDPRITEPPLEYCQTGLGYSTIAALEDDLEKRAKQAAANELLDAEIQSIALASCSPSRDDITDLLIDRIKISEAPIYSNDRKNFAGVCISILPYVEEDSITEAELAQIADDVCTKPTE